MSSARIRTRSPGSNAGSALRVLTRILGRSGVALQPLDSSVAEQKALAAGAILHEQDRGLELVRAAPLKHRRLDQLRAHARHREAEQKGQNAEQAWHAAERRGGQAPPQPEQKNTSNEQTGRAEPDRRLDRQREVDGDAGAERDRQPKQPALALREQVAGEPGQEAGAVGGHGRCRPTRPRLAAWSGRCAIAVFVLDHAPTSWLHGTSVYQL